VGDPELLFVGHGAERTGPPVFLANFEGWLADHTDLELTTVLVRGGPLVADYARWGTVRVLDVPRSPGRLAERALSAARLARPAAGVRAARDGHRFGAWAEARAVYVNTVSGPTLRALRRVRDEATVVVHVHEMEAALRYGIDDADRRLLRDRTDHWVAASQAVADNLVANHGVAPGRIRVHHEFVDPVDPVEGDERRAARRRLGVPEDAFLVGGCGMLEWRKAPELFVRLAADLRARTDRPLAFVWVGGTDRGPLWAPLDHEARHLGVHDVVRFVGAQARPADWFRVLDVFALTSREDAFPLSALEAASAGAPVVTFDTGGMVELVGDGSCGAVVPYPDTGTFADVLAALADDDEGRRSLGATAAATVRERHVTEVAAPALWADLAGWIGR
jgi:glycosyltransferase involved in cell wall biosynthesis